MNKRAVALLSGGLDSTHAVKMMLEQGIEVFAINFVTIFCTCTAKGCRHQASKVAEELKVPIKVLNITEEYIDVIKSPKHGSGRGMNPCIDCRIFTFKKAREYMEELGASFVITGEVLGERPMSQRMNAIKIIEKESGLCGLIVRPLSARNFKPSIPEKMGIVDRNRLLDIQGRQRVRQIGLAKELGITEYPCPSGGCLLTDIGFSNRLKDLFKYNGYNLNDLHMLKVGRHFRISEACKLIVGRDEHENNKLLSLAKEGDLIFKTEDLPGPIGILRGGLLWESDSHSIAAEIIARYSDGKLEENVEVSFYKFPDQLKKSILSVKPAEESILNTLRI